MARRILFASEDAAGAALLILRDGYFDNEVPIAVLESGEYVVLEGNRRVSALQALAKPSLVPSHEQEIKTLLKRFATEALDLPTRIRVLVAPDRETARPHIARLHTGLPKRRWSRDQQATFYYSLLDGHTTVADVKAMYPAVTVPRFIRMAVVRRFLSGALFGDESLHDYVTSSELAMSSFEYAYRRGEIADAIGLEFDSDGLLLPADETPEQIGARLPKQKREALEYLIAEFRANRLNTRSDAFKKGHPAGADLLRRLTGEQDSPTGGAPDPSKTGGAPPPPETGRPPATAASGSGQQTSTDDADVPTGAALTGEAPQSASRGPNRPETRKTLDLSGVEFSNIPVGLKRRYIELRGIEVDELPAATAMLLRAVLEGTIKWHFEAKGQRVSGELNKVMTDVRKEYGAIGGLKDSINTIIDGGGNRPGSVTWFNRPHHNADFRVENDDVRRAWDLVVPLLRHLLRT